MSPLNYCAKSQPEFLTGDLPIRPFAYTIAALVFPAGSPDAACFVLDSLVYIPFRLTKARSCNGLLAVLFLVLLRGDCDGNADEHIRHQNPDPDQGRG